MGNTITTGHGDDEDPFTLEYSAGEGALAVNVWTSELDGIPVVQIDTAGNVGVFRVAINDGDIWHGNADASHWADDPDYPATDWIAEVTNGDTRLGYQLWVRERRMASKWAKECVDD